MSKFESFTPTVESSEDKNEISLEQRKSIIENVINKFPRLRSLVLAFITTTTVMSAPESAEPAVPVQGTKIEQKALRTDVETAEMALEKVSDQEFKDTVNKIEAEMKDVGSNIPTNSLYSEIWKSTCINGGATFNEKKSGSLPESAQHVFIGAEHMSGIYTHDGAIANMFDGTKSSFYVSPTENGSIVEGGKIEIEGIGSTRGEALQNALEHSVMFLGEEVTSNTELHDKNVDDGKDSSAESSLTEVIKTGGKHFITEYKIVKGKEVKDGRGDKEYRVTVEIQGGTFTPEK